VSGKVRAGENAWAGLTETTVAASTAAKTDSACLVTVFSSYSQSDYTRTGKSSAQHPTVAGPVPSDSRQDAFFSVFAEIFPGLCASKRVSGKDGDYLRLSRARVCLAKKLSHFSCGPVLGGLK
jgi:hypothetical protein